MPIKTLKPTSSLIKVKPLEIEVNSETSCCGVNELHQFAYRSAFTWVGGRFDNGYFGLQDIVGYQMNKTTWECSETAKNITIEEYVRLVMSFVAKYLCDDIHLVMYWGEDEERVGETGMAIFRKWRRELKSFGFNITTLGKSRMGDYPIWQAILFPGGLDQIKKMLKSQPKRFKLVLPSDYLPDEES